MTTLFTRIIEGDIPGTFVWRDDRCVAFMSINPLAPGHVLVVPIEELDHWIDGDPALLAHLFEVTRVIGLAQRSAFQCERVGVIIAGYEVPHTHVHVIPTSSMAELSFANAAASVERDELAAAADAIRAQLEAMGHAEVVPAPDVAPTDVDAPVTVSGTVTYRQRIALPPDAVAIVQVRDVSLSDAPSITVVEQRIEPAGQVPIPFTLEVPAAALTTGHRYGVTARIEVGGELEWISDTHHPVAVDGPTTVEIPLVQSAGESRS